MSAQEQQNWYYASAKGEQQGPVLIGELSSLAAKGTVGPETLVWSEGYRDWIPANEISDLLSGARAAVHISPAHTTQASAPALDLKPRKALFVLPRFAMGLIVSGVVGGVITGLMTTIGESPWPGLAVFAAGTALGAVAALVAYRKERYQVQDSRVICRRGGLLSDQTNELELRNITCVKVSLPWLRHKFFGVGNVIIETAGTSKPVVMRLIDEPEAIYAGMRERMKMNGYDLNQDQLLHEERPAIIGILGECFGLLGGAGFLLSVVISAILSGPDDPATPESALVLLLVSATVVVVAFVILRFLDYRHRTYRVYNGVVVYEEGFLTRENAFIPYENITDSNTRSSIFDRIFGLCDVQVSCQGSGAEIKFRRLKHGVALSAAIDQLVARGRAKEKPPTRSTRRDHPAPASRDLPRRSHPDAIPTGETMTGEFRMDAVRTLVPLMLLFPLLPLWIAAMLQGCIRLMSTRYFVRDGSLRHSYRFLTVHDREFAYDKITGIMIKQNLWDRMFGTMTLKFWSLGSGKALEFAHVSGRQLNLPSLMRQAGIPAASTEPYEAQAAFTVPTWLRANLKHLPVPLLFCAAVVFAAIQMDAILYGLLLLPVIAGSVSCLYSKVYHSRQRLRFHDHHIEAKQGVIARRRYLVRHSNVKRGMTTCYPGGGDGDLTIFVAAEEELLPGTQAEAEPAGESEAGLVHHRLSISGP